MMVWAQQAKVLYERARVRVCAYVQLCLMPLLVLFSLRRQRAAVATVRPQHRCLAFCADGPLLLLLLPRPIALH